MVLIIFEDVQESAASSPSKHQRIINDANNDKSIRYKWKCRPTAYNGQPQCLANATAGDAGSDISPT